MGGEVDEGGEVSDMSEKCVFDGCITDATYDVAVCESHAVAGWLKVTPDPDPPRTVRVRIAVRLQADGKWCASGCWDESDAEAESLATEGLSDPLATVWLEADIPLPEEVTVTVEVVE